MWFIDCSCVWGSKCLYLLDLCCILCRALLRSGTNIPECRRLELLDTVAQYCDCSAEDVTDEMIQQASEVNPKYIFHYASTFCTLWLARIPIQSYIQSLSCSNQERIRMAARVRACNSVKFETSWNLLKIVTHTAHACIP